MTEPEKEARRALGWGEPRGRATRLLLLRHGEVSPEAKTILYGSMDVPLSDRGRAESVRTAKEVGKAPLSAVLSSDLERAVFLAERIATRAKAPGIVDAGLRERSFGEWQGRPIAELMEQHAEEYARLQAARWSHRVSPGAENIEDVAARAMPPVRAALAEHAGGVVAVVAHSGPLRAILGGLLRWPGEVLFTFVLGYCGVTVLDVYDDGTARLERLNERRHLGGDPFPPPRSPEGAA
ncbi:MAG: histidine phosphatase family protein [Candidatus Sumerlaeia bacterium]|nr:histidine phosphatase family protein [Candidatus Sumerlaeia bacterium]